MSAKIKNLYIARLTTQERPCFVCSKFTSVVLTSADNSNDDWFYTCRSHLGDFNFCSRITDASSSPKPTKQRPISLPEKLKDKQPESDSVVDLVSSIGSALKSWRNKSEDNKKEEDDGKEKEKEKELEKEKEKKEEIEEKKEEEKNKLPSSTITDAQKSPQTPRFILQRDYFYLRQREYIKKLQKKQADEKLKTLDFPSVPKGIPGSPSSK